jgi:iron complex transport system substrate-binding protein
MRFAFLMLTAAVMAGCRNKPLPETNPDPNEASAYASYASGFRVSDEASYKIVTVLNPWQYSHDVSYTYVLSEQEDMLPDSLSQLPWIRTPVKRVIALSTTHVAMIDQLGQAASIVGLSGSKFIYSPEIRKGISSGAVVDVGYGQGLDFETIVGLDPDVLFIYGVEGNVVATLEKLTELGIPVVFCGEYLEAHPLGKAEWIKFFSLFFKLEEEADSFFHHIDSSYNQLANLASEIEEKPGVLTGLPWKDAWHMAGGQSFAARLIEDAGGDFLWSDNSSTQAIPMDLESVYLRAVNAGVWINPGAASSIDDIGRLDERLLDLQVLKNGQVYNNNLRINAIGGNDYWESGTVRPDLVLADLIGVFHPDLLEDHRFVYYRQLK